MVIRATPIMAIATHVTVPFSLDVCAMFVRMALMGSVLVTSSGVTKSTILISAIKNKMLPSLAKRLKVVQHVPMDLFCMDTKSRNFTGAYAVNDASVCLITQMQFLAMVGFLKNDKKLQKLTSKHKNLMDSVYKLSKAEESRVLGLKDGAASEYLDTVYHSKMDNPTAFKESDKVLATLMKEYGHLVVPPAQDPHNFMCKTLVKLMGPAVKGWSILKYLGGGEYGKVFLMHTPAGEKVAVKLMIETEPGETQSEIKAQKVFSKVGLGPELFKYTSSRTAGGVKVDLIVMEPVDYTLREVLCMAGNDVGRVRAVVAQVMALMRGMRRHKLTHGDMHDENVAFRVKNGKLSPVLIDFGFSVTNGSFPQVDAEQLVRVLVEDGMGPLYPHALLIVEALRDFLKDQGIKYNIKGTSPGYFKIHDEYLETYRGGDEFGDEESDDDDDEAPKKSIQLDKEMYDDEFFSDEEGYDDELFSDEESSDDEFFGDDSYDDDVDDDLFKDYEFDRYDDGFDDMFADLDVDVFGTYDTDYEYAPQSKDSVYTRKLKKMSEFDSLLGTKYRDLF